MPEEQEVEGGNGKAQETKSSQDIKLAEIWFRNGQLQMDGADVFFADKVRALGVIEYCKDIIKTYEKPPPSKSKIVPANNQMMDFVRSKFKKKGK